LYFGNAIPVQTETVSTTPEQFGFFNAISTTKKVAKIMHFLTMQITKRKLHNKPKKKIHIFANVFRRSNGLH
jgi:hypothetical protein